MLHPSEVRVSLVLRMDPEVLLDYGTRVTTDVLRASGPHWFVCVARQGDQSSWVATSSRPARHRQRVTRKWGHAVWTAPDTFADLYQVWTVPTFFALRAAITGVDPSFRGARNYALVDLACEDALAA